MGVKDGFMGASIMMKIAVIVLLVANLFSWIAFTTTSWVYLKPSTTGYGLWRICTESGSCTLMDGTRSDWYGAFQAFGIFGYVALNVAMFLLCAFLFLQFCKGNAEAKMAVIICCFVGAVCWLLAVIIFAAEWDYNGVENDKFGFSFALAIIAFICAIVAGILVIVDGKSGGTSPA